MKKLNIKDFTLDKKLNYYFYKTKTREICIEPCLNGYDIAVYNSKKLLIRPKICTNSSNFIDDFIFGREIDRTLVLDDALKIVNRLVNDISLAKQFNLI